MPKPAEEIVAWIAGLSPTDELPVRMALCLTNPWCHEDKAWQLRIEALRMELLKSTADEERCAQRAAAIARDMDSALRSMMAEPPDSIDR
ncbi:MAG TPA: hypothetical protein VNF99_04155 [Stellaceae bacterium]|nr:hypothetical protein [Stellaceae bacterium]